MIANLKRIIQTAWKGLTRNKWLSVACITMMVLSLIIFTSILLFNYAANTLIRTLQDKMDISIYFKAEIPEEDILKIRDELLGNELIAKIDYVSKDEALAAFKEKSKYNPTIQKALEVLGDNPLTASLNIKAKSTADYSKIVEDINNSAFKDKLETINLTENQKIVSQVDRLAKAVKIGSGVAILLLAFLSFIISFNTIRMAIYSLKEEIEIMKLVGGSNWLIRGPFLLEGLLQGLIASFITTLIISLVILSFGAKIENFLPGIGLVSYFWSHFWFLFMLQTVFGLVLGLVSSFWALNHYLKV
ncbi:MAG: Cell division protein FtsX [Patescibacteria group bacterium]|nr:Cell division protein FtsX [Patescibacteria group bacterium]